MLYYILIVLLSLYIGFELRSILDKYRRKHFGDIVVTENEGVTLYSLELNTDPQKIKVESEVTFKVVIPELESVRE